MKMEKFNFLSEENMCSLIYMLDISRACFSLNDFKLRDSQRVIACVRVREMKNPIFMHV